MILRVIEKLHGERGTPAGDAGDALLWCLLLEADRGSRTGRC